jgi:zinc-ribbon domain
MALIECPECGRPVSDKAAACPSCGHPIAAHYIYPRGLAPSDLTAAVGAEKRGTKEAALAEKLAGKEAARAEERARRELGRSQGGRSSIGRVLVTILVLGIIAVGLGRMEVSQKNEEKPCTSDWRKCSDNADLVNHYLSDYRAQDSCKSEAEKLARYGSPKFPWLYPFSTFYSGDQYLKTGIAVLVEKEAQFSNAFGGMVRSTVTCTYDLNQKKVLNVSIAPN